MDIEKVELGIVQSDTSLGTLNNRNCSFTYVLLHPETSVVYICLRARRFWRAERVEVGFDDDFMDMYSRDGKNRGSFRRMHT